MKKFFQENINPESISRVLFVISLCMISFAYGYLSLASGWFPHSLITNTIDFIDEHFGEPDLPWYYVETEYTTQIPVYSEDEAFNGLSLVTSIVEDRMLAASIINMKGDVIYRWELDWFELWPDPDHIPESDHQYPRSKPGTFIQGAVLLENGNLIFNFTYLGMVRVDPCGNVVWRLPYRTHHSLELDEDGNLWVPGQIRHVDSVPELPYHKPIFYEFTVLKVSLDGEILEEISVIDLLKENDLYGLMGLSSKGNRVVNVTGDTLHLNDVEVFPSDLEEGVFKAGDIMLSLRNINTILVFREENFEVTEVTTGGFVRQHDPDFIDGDTISIFDNFNIAPWNFGHHSRILIKSFAENNQQVYYTGNEQDPFYTDVQGNHQWLPNGNLIITESRKGRAFEIDPQGKIVWEYINLVGEGKAGIIDDVERLPDYYSEDFFNRLKGQCIHDFEN